MIGVPLRLRRDVLVENLTIALLFVEVLMVVGWYNSNGKDLDTRYEYEALFDRNLTEAEDPFIRRGIPVLSRREHDVGDSIFFSRQLVEWTNKTKSKRGDFQDLVDLRGVKVVFARINISTTKVLSIGWMRLPAMQYVHPGV